MHTAVHRRQRTTLVGPTSESSASCAEARQIAASTSLCVMLGGARTRVLAYCGRARRMRCVWLRLQCVCVGCLQVHAASWCALLRCCGFRRVFVFAHPLRIVRRRAFAYAIGVSLGAGASCAVLKNPTLQCGFTCVSVPALLPCQAFCVNEDDAGAYVNEHVKSWAGNAGTCS